MWTCSPRTQGQPTTDLAYMVNMPAIQAQLIWPSNSVPARYETLSPSAAEQTALTHYSETTLGPMSSAIARPNTSAGWGHTCVYGNCSRSFRHWWHLRNHVRRHHRYRCNLCPQSYAFYKNLLEHKRNKHEGLRFPCDVPGCSVSVAHEKNLKRHKERKHANCA